MSWTSVSCFCVCLLTNMPQHAFLFVGVQWFVYVCVLVQSSCLSLLHSRERNNFLLSTPACLHMLLSALGGLLALPSLCPSRDALFDAHWQEPGSGCSGFPCVSKYVHVLLSGEFHMRTNQKQLGCLAAFRKTGLFSPPIHCPPAVCWSCSAPKENAEDSLHLHEGDADYKLTNNTKQRMTSDLCTI